MNCPQCSSSFYIKSGKAKDRQRYKCKKCNYYYTVTQKSTAKPKLLKKQALQLYLEGLSFRSIGRVLGVSNVSVLNWIRSFGKEVQSLPSDDSKVDFVELDEMHSYIESKKTTVGHRLLLIDMGKDSSNSLLVTEAPNRKKTLGTHKREQNQHDIE